MGQLKALGLAYHGYLDRYGQAPRSSDDLLEFAGSDPTADAGGLQQLKDRGAVVRWGVSLRDAKQGSSNYVLAYPPGAKQQGGFVLMLDGAVGQMTATQLAAALRSK